MGSGAYAALDAHGGIPGLRGGMRFDTWSTRDLVLANTPRVAGATYHTVEYMPRFTKDHL